MVVVFGAFPYAQCRQADPLPPADLSGARFSFDVTNPICADFLAGPRGNGPAPALKGWPRLRHAARFLQGRLTSGVRSP